MQYLSHLVIREIRRSERSFTLFMSYGHNCIELGRGDGDNAASKAFLPAVRRSTRGFFLRTVNSVQMLKLLIKGPETSETQHITQFYHDTNVGMVTFGLRGHLEAKIASKKFV